jgi:hypothetical protein
MPVIKIAESKEELPNSLIFIILSLNLPKCKVNKGNNKITELRTILQRESQNS